MAMAGGDSVPTNPDFKYLVKEGKRIGDTFYLIEISTNGRDLLITAFSGQEEDGSSLELLMDAVGHRRVHEEVGGEYCKLVDRVRVRKGKLYIS
jgi:hypothetical protein